MSDVSITRGTTPTFTLRIFDDVPEGSVPTVTVAQESYTNSPTVVYDHEAKTVSFDMSSEETSRFAPGTHFSLQQTMTFPDGTVHTFPMHDVLVKDMLYSEGEDPEPPKSDTVLEETSDTSVNQDVVYIGKTYTEFPPVDGAPLDLGLYELTGNAYVPSQDREFDEEKVYFTESVEPVTPSGNENPSSLGWMVPVDSMDEFRDDDPDGDYEEDYDEVMYEEITPEPDDNPSEEGWYELDDGMYVLTYDESVVSGKTYYTLEDTPYYDDADEMYEDFDMEAFAAEYNITILDGSELSTDVPEQEEWDVNDQGNTTSQDNEG